MQPNFPDRAVPVNLNGHLEYKLPGVQVPSSKRKQTSMIDLTGGGEKFPFTYMMAPDHKYSWSPGSLAHPKKMDKRMDDRNKKENGRGASNNERIWLNDGDDNQKLKGVGLCEETWCELIEREERDHNTARDNAIRISAENEQDQNTARDNAIRISAENWRSLIDLNNQVKEEKEEGVEILVTKQSKVHTKGLSKQMKKELTDGKTIEMKQKLIELYRKHATEIGKLLISDKFEDMICLAEFLDNHNSVNKNTVKTRPKKSRKGTVRAQKEGGGTPPPLPLLLNDDHEEQKQRGGGPLPTQIITETNNAATCGHIAGQGITASASAFGLPAFATAVHMVQQAHTQSAYADEPQINLGQRVTHGGGLDLFGPMNPMTLINFVLGGTGSDDNYELQRQLRSMKNKIMAKGERIVTGVITWLQEFLVRKYYSEHRAEMMLEVAIRYNSLLNIPGWEDSFSIDKLKFALERIHSNLQSTLVEGQFVLSAEEFKDLFWTHDKFDWEKDWMKTWLQLQGKWEQYLAEKIEKQ